MKNRGEGVSTNLAEAPERLTWYSTAALVGSYITRGRVQTRYFLGVMRWCRNRSRPQDGMGGQVDPGLSSGNFIRSVPEHLTYIRLAYSISETTQNA